MPSKCWISIAMLVYRSVVLVVSIQQGTFEYFRNEIVRLVVESVQHFSAIMLSLLVSHYVHGCSTPFQPIWEMFFPCWMKKIMFQQSITSTGYYGEAVNGSIFTFFDLWWMVVVPLKVLLYNPELASCHEFSLQTFLGGGLKYFSFSPRFLRKW